MADEPFWPERECLHEHATDQSALMTFGYSDPVRIDPAYCPECGKVWEVMLDDD